ncbi:MAG: NAD(P)-dependent oxidoreductase [Candidatus Krumholzibacteriota bacterium]
MKPSDGSSGTGGPVIALTGATGFLGSHIADTLLARGFGVRASIRPTSSLRWLDNKPVETRRTDLTDPDDCRGFLAGTSGLIHCAGVVSAPAKTIYHVANVTSTARLLEAAAAAWKEQRDTKAFVLISSLAAHGPAGLERPALESDPCRPITEYGRSKLAAEELVSAGMWPFRTATLRPPSLYGPRDREFLPLIKLATHGWTGRLGRRMTGLSLVDGRDAAAAAVDLLETDAASGTFFVDDGKTGYDWSALNAALEKMAGRRVRTIQLPLVVLKILSFLAGRSRAARSPVLNRDRIRDLQTEGWVCDGGRLAAATGFRARRDAARGFAETLDFYREEGWL